MELWESLLEKEPITVSELIEVLKNVEDQEFEVLYDYGGTLIGASIISINRETKTLMIE